MLFQDDHGTKKYTNKSHFCLFFFVIFNASLPDELPCLLMSLPCKWKIHRDSLSTVDSAWHCHPENRCGNALICRCTACQAQPQSRYLPLLPPEQLLRALMGISAGKDYGEAADLVRSLSLGCSEQKWEDNQCVWPILTKVDSHLGSCKCLWAHVLYSSIANVNTWTHLAASWDTACLLSYSK